MKLKSILSFVVLFGALMAWGCSSDSGTTTPAPDSSTDDSGDADTTGDTGETSEDSAAVQGEATLLVTAYCGTCGHAKGSDQCCAEDAATCDQCNLHKGASLCCKDLGEEYAGKDLCGKCGHVVGSEQCCAEDAVVCQDCKLHKGSPLCCKLTDSKPEDKGSEG